MEISLWVEIVDAGKQVTCQRVIKICRPSGVFRPEELGLTLACRRGVSDRGRSWKSPRGQAHDQWHSKPARPGSGMLMPKVSPSLSAAHATARSSRVC